MHESCSVLSPTAKRKPTQNLLARLAVNFLLVLLGSLLGLYRLAAWLGQGSMAASSALREVAIT